MHQLLGLATQRAMSGVLLHGRGGLAVLSPIGGVICAHLECPRAPWEPWNHLSRSWCYWGRSGKHSALICWGAVVPLMLDVWAKFEGDRSAGEQHAVAGKWRWCGGSVVAVAVARTSPRHRPVGPPLYRVGLLALSHQWVHICACCRIGGTSTASRSQDQTVDAPHRMPRALTRHRGMVLVEPEVMGAGVDVACGRWGDRHDRRGTGEWAKAKITKINKKNLHRMRMGRWHTWKRPGREGINLACSGWEDVARGESMQHAVGGV